MCKMIKYEFRKNLFPLLILFITFIAINIYVLGSGIAKSQIHTSISVSLFVIASFACYIFALLYGILAYNNDLKNKSGYLVFMAPLSTYKIIGAKLVATLITGIILVVMIYGLGSLDYIVLAKVFRLQRYQDFIGEILSSFGVNVTMIVLQLISFILIFLIQFFMIVTVAYLSISLSSTVLQNKKFKGVVSFMLFAILIVAIEFIASKLPTIGSTSQITSLGRMMIHILPQIGLYLFVMIASFIGSGLLLGKKISL